MQKLIRWIPMLLLSIAIALAISVLPQFVENKSIKVDQYPPQLTAEVMKLTSGNLVDQFSKLPLNHKLDRIDWNGMLLHVELNVGNELSSEQSVYEDLFTLSRFSFSHTDNVETLLVRILTGDDRGSRWILAMNAPKSAWDGALASKATETEDGMKQYLRQHFQFSTSAVWKKLEAL